MSVTAGSRYFDILSTNNSTKIWKNSKSRLGMSIETRTSRLVKKTGVEKSRWTVPLSQFDVKTDLNWTCFWQWNKQFGIYFIVESSLEIWEHKHEKFTKIKL